MGQASCSEVFKAQPPGQRPRNGPPTPRPPPRVRDEHVAPEEVTWDLQRLRDQVRAKEQALQLLRNDAIDPKYLLHVLARQEGSADAPPPQMENFPASTKMQSLQAKAGPQINDGDAAAGACRGAMGAEAAASSEQKSCEFKEEPADSLKLEVGKESLDRAGKWEAGMEDKLEDSNFEEAGKQHDLDRSGYVEQVLEESFDSPRVAEPKNHELEHCEGTETRKQQVDSSGNVEHVERSIDSPRKMEESRKDEEFDNCELKKTRKQHLDNSGNLEHAVEESGDPQEKEPTESSKFEKDEPSQLKDTAVGTPLAAPHGHP